MVSRAHCPFPVDRIVPLRKRAPFVPLARGGLFPLVALSLAPSVSRGTCDGGGPAAWGSRHLFSFFSSHRRRRLPHRLRRCRSRSSFFFTPPRGTSVWLKEKKEESIKIFPPPQKTSQRSCRFFFFFPPPPKRTGTRGPTKTKRPFAGSADVGSVRFGTRTHARMRPTQPKEG